MNSKNGKKPVGTAKKPKPEALTGDLFAAAFKRHKRAAAATIAAVLVIAVIAAWLCGRSGIAEGEAVFYFFDVGQGDAAAVVTSEGCILIDAGTNDAEDELCRQMRRAGIRRIDLAVLTHPHEDHIGGGDAVLRAFPVREIWTNGAADANGAKTAAHGEDYEFTITKDADYNYTVTATIAGKDVAVTGEYKISGADVTGDITIVITKTEKSEEETMRSVSLLEEARRDLVWKVNYNYALKNLLIKIGK